MTRVDLDGVSKAYAGTTALDDLSLSIRDGEFFTLVGPSGCGKTTTLRLLGGFEEPTAGRVRFDGERVAGVPPEERGVGVVFQNYALFPHMSVAENVGYGLRFSDPPAGESREERVADLLDLVDLGGMGGRDPEALSGGQQQRVALARALAPGPRLLLLDEPMSALDARLRERLRLQVKRIQSELGVTTVYVTHDQEEALAVSDRVAVMHDGRVEQVGTPRGVYRRPETRFVAEFVGDNNVFEGRVVADGDTSAGGPTAGGPNADARPSGAPGDRSDSPLETEGIAVRVGDARFRLRVGGEGPPSGSELGDGDAVTFCVRPQHLRFGVGPNRFEATVESVEFLGERTRVHLDWAGTPVRVRVGEFDGVAGDRATVGFDPADARVLGRNDEGSP